MGVPESPRTLDEAAAGYLEARGQQERRLGVRVSRTAEREVMGAFDRWSESL